jgi:hypothetical protein
MADTVKKKAVVKKKVKKAAGRPQNKINAEGLAEFEASEGGLNPQQIADLFKVSKSTLFRILKRDPHIMELYKSKNAAVDVKIINTLVQKCLSGDTTAIIFYLKTRCGWRETSEATKLEMQKLRLEIEKSRQQINTHQLTQMNSILKLRESGLFTSEQLQIMADQIA